MLCRDIEYIEAQVSEGMLTINEAAYYLKSLQELCDVLGETIDIPLLPGLSVIYPEDPLYGLGEIDEADEGN